MNLMLIEIIKLTGTEVKLLFIVTMYRKAGPGVLPEATVCLLCDAEKVFQTFYLYVSARSVNEGVACADRELLWACRYQKFK